MPILNLKNKTILVTGGTGSFGRNFVKHLLGNSGIKKIIVFSRDELKQFHMQKDKDFQDGRLRFFLGDIRDPQRLHRSFHGVDIVVHAAALKQIPTLEYNPFEAVKTNIIGSQNVLETAIDEGIEKVLLISTDKAAQPVNLYGSTKLCAEKLFINGNSYAGGTTMLSCVRYGNVVGSRGSIIDVLLRNKDAKKVHLTDEQMTRFWITLEQSFELVAYALNNMAGGEIFIPKIPSMKLVDLFETMVPRAKREIIGMRPGEKLHELLITPEEARHSVEFDKYYVILPENRTFETRYRHHLKNSRRLPTGYYFSSDNNKDWLSKKEFQKIVDKLIPHS